MLRVFKRAIKLIIFLVVILIIAFFALTNINMKGQKNENMIFGISFNPEYAREMNLDEKKVFESVIGDWDFKYIRLSAQWDLIENIKGEYDFEELDYFMNEASKRNVRVMLALGRKTPRWPECHLPDWAKEKDYDVYKPFLLEYMKVVVERYKDHEALEVWQVENEPFLNFGLCRALPKEDLKEEIDIVKEIDESHKIIITDSGELSLWRKTAGITDLFGMTMYRVVWNKWTGYWNYDWLPAWWYNFRLKMNNRIPEESYVVELQAEPWMPGGSVTSTSLQEQFKSMDLKRLEKNVEYAKESGLARSYLWGSEWWYFLNEKDKKIGGEFLEYIKGLKKE